CTSRRDRPIGATGPSPPSEHESVNTSDSDLWAQSARWWQATFTGGADPEYVEQILPLVAQHLPRAGRVLDVGTGEGQVARLAAVSSCSWTIRCSRGPAAAGSTTTSWASSIGASAPTSWRTAPSRRWTRGCLCPSCTGPSPGT